MTNEAVLGGDAGGVALRLPLRSVPFWIISGLLSMFLDSFLYLRMWDCEYGFSRFAEAAVRFWAFDHFGFFLILYWRLMLPFVVEKAAK